MTANMLSVFRSMLYWADILLDVILFYQPSTLCQNCC